MKRIISILAFVLPVWISGTLIVYAQNFPLQSKVSLKIGQSTILKGVRGQCEDTRAPAWNRIKGRLPRSKLGTFSNGGSGEVNSGRCGGVVPARGIKFKAKNAGSETLTIFKDRISITVE